MRNIARATLHSIVVVGILAIACILPVFGEDLFPYIPLNHQVSLAYWRSSGNSFVNVSIEFPMINVNITDWGSPILVGNQVSVNAMIYAPIVQLPVYWTAKHTYALGILPPGLYVFTFKVWDLAVKIVQFDTSNIIVPDDHPTIQAAINAANPGDSVFVRAGEYSEPLTINKTLSVFGENRGSTIFNGTTIDPMMVIEASRVNVSHFTFVGWSIGNIVVNGTNDICISFNNIVFNAVGIDVEYSSNVTMENNAITGFGLDNIGIMLAHSSECVIVNNTITDAVYCGIKLFYSNSSLIRKNIINHNDYGVMSTASSQNRILENTVSHSGNSGIFLESMSSGNIVLRNSFVDNWAQVRFYGSSVNVWNDTYPLGGNYWSDYTGIDSNHDGIGDTQYVIDSKNQDNYPLMHPWKLGDTNYDGAVDILDLIVIANALGSKPGDPNWNPRTDVKEDLVINVLDLIKTATRLGT